VKPSLPRKPDRGQQRRQRKLACDRVKRRRQQKLARSKRRILRRLDRKNLGDLKKPVFFSRLINYEIGDRTRAISCGGIGVIHNLVQSLGLPQAINDNLKLLVFPMPYFESDHVLTIAYNVLCGGTCLEDLELLRQDENFLNALGAVRIPDPTTAGDFCRRFSPADIAALQKVFDGIRLKVWAKQPSEFFAQARIDLDGHLVETTGACKQGMDIAYDGTWGYHPLLVSLANTGEVLRIVNRSGNRPSHEGAAEQVDQALEVCFRSGFLQALLRGDTDGDRTSPDSVAGLGGEDVMVATVEGRVVGAIVSQPAPGRVGWVWPPVVGRSDGTSVVCSDIRQRLIGAAAAQLAKVGCRLAQARSQSCW